MQTGIRAYEQNNLVLAAGFLFAMVVSFMAVKTGNLTLLAALSLPVLAVVAVNAPFTFPFGLYAFLLPFDTLLIMGDKPQGATLTKLLGGVCILALVIKGVTSKRFRAPAAPVVWWACFIAVAFFSAVWSFSFDLSSFVSRMGTAGGLFALYLAVSLYGANPREYETLKRFIMFGGVAAALYAMYLFGFAGIAYNAASGRASLIYGENATDPNKFAFSLLIPLGVAYHYFLGQGGLSKKGFYLLVMLVIGYGIVLSGSRGGLVGAGAMLAVMAYLSPRKGAAVLATAALVVMAAYFAPESYIGRLEAAYQSGGAGRLDIWKVGLAAFKHHWLLGVGLDNFGEAFDQYQFSVSHSRYLGFSRAAHNIFLDTAVMFGVVGLTVLVCAMYSHLKLAGNRWGRPADRALLFACFFGVAAHSMTLDVIWNKSFWLLWMLIIVYGTVSTAGGMDEPDSVVPHVP